MNDIKIEDREPWYRSQRGESEHLEVWCGGAYLLVRKCDGFTEIGYQDEETYLPTAYSDEEIADWLRIFQWRSEQKFGGT